MTNNGALNMTQGSPYQLILRFSIPLLLANLLQQLYNMVDSAVVGRFVGTEALAAVGTTFPIVFMIISLFIGIGMGASVIISQYFGAGDLEGVRKTVDTLYITMFVLSLVIAVIGLLVSRPILLLIHTPPDTIDLATTYMQITFIGTLAIFGFNVNGGILQGLGDSKSPLIYVGLATVINIILDLVFVLAFGWGVAGVAWATVIAQFFAFIYGVVHINRFNVHITINFKALLFDRKILIESLKIGLPVSLQNLSFAIGAVVIQALINSYQAPFMAGFNAANKIDAFAFLPLMSFSNAITTYVGQNVGAGRWDRVKDGIRSTLLLSLGSCVAISLSLVVFATPLLKLFSSEPAVLESGRIYLITVVPFYFLLAILFVLNGAMRGAGSTMIPLIATLTSLWLIRVPFAYLFVHWFGRDFIYFSYGAGWLIGLLAILPYFFSGRWKKAALV
ncbi:MAG: MATE family efflux transporter [Eubacteriales bacterium]|nr:MATE family efflux transporter [Eubacteriales bacterium]